ncbi:PAN domain family protein [Acanthocheilonema viteae]
MHSPTVFIPYSVMILPFLLLLLFLAVNTFADKQSDLCIQAYPNLQITCAIAYEQRILPNEHQCSDLCLEMSAQTCQYNRIRRECKLYNIVVALQRKHSRQKEHHITSMEIGIMRKSNNLAMKSCVPSISPAIGFLLLLNDGCRLEQSGHSSGNVTSKPAHSNVPMMSDHRKPLIPDCTSGFSAYIEVIDGIEVVAESLTTLQTRTPEVCVYICRKNKLSGGNLLPIECHSAQYDRVNKRCILFNASVTPTGNAKFIPNKNMIYFEKICISDMVGRKCDVILRRVPQHVLVGHATVVIDAPSHNYCIETCLRSLEMFGFTCRSAVHFHEYPKSNCILNEHSARTRPQYFISEREQKMDYIELSECFIHDQIQ